jgi:adenine/guanine phosphoribosyltransferase-like PRPP-binding protein
MPYLDDQELHRLAEIVLQIPDFPRPGITFRHVLGIAEHPDGLSLVSQLLDTHFNLTANQWVSVSTLVCPEAGGFVFAAALASRVGKPLALVREAGKLSSPTYSVAKGGASHISAAAAAAAAKGGDEGTEEKRIDISRDAVREGGMAVVVDDVLATGTTLCAVLRLLTREVRVKVEDVTVLVVAEFPFHRGREMLRREGFGGVRVQSLLVFGGA